MNDASCLSYDAISSSLVTTNQTYKPTNGGKWVQFDIWYFHHLLPRVWFCHHITMLCYIIKIGKIQGVIWIKMQQAIYFPMRTNWSPELLYFNTCWYIRSLYPIGWKRWHWFVFALRRACGRVPLACSSTLIVVEHSPIWRIPCLNLIEFNISVYCFIQMKNCELGYWYIFIA